MLSSWGKKHKQAVLQENIFFNQIFNHLIVCMWTAWCTRLKHTQKVAISEETELLRISKKSHFPKTDYRFWKSYKALSWNQTMCPFGRGPLVDTLQSKLSPVSNLKVPPISHTFGLSANFQNFNNILITWYSCEKH